MEEEKKESKEELTGGKSLFWIAFSIIASLVFLLGCMIYTFSKTVEDSDTPAANIITAITKKPPTVKVDPEIFTSIKFYVYAVDNYDEVDISFSILDDKGGILTSQTLQGFNYRKGNTYVLSQTLSLKQMFTSSSVRYSVSYYK